MEKIVAKISTSGILLHYELHYEEHVSKLSRQELMDFVDTEIPFFYGDEKMNINDYLGETTCFAARVSNHSYNPF